MPDFVHDIFLAYASADVTYARELYDVLDPRDDIDVFLDEKSLDLGDNWMAELPEAVAASRVIVVLMSRAWETSHYAQDEVADAIDRARKDPRVRVVPVFLDDAPAPYGLRQVVSARVGTGQHEHGSLADIAAKLLALVDRLRRADAPGDEPGLGTDLPPPEPPPESRDRLPRVLSDWLDMVVKRYEEIPLLGFEQEITFPICVDDLYVQLNAVQSVGAKRSPNYENAEEAEEEIRDRGAGYTVEMLDAFSFARDQGPRGKRGVVVLGDPGSGKTTQLKQILVRIARAGAASMGLPDGTMPMLLLLRELDEVPQTFEEIVRAIVTKTEGERAPAILEALAEHPQVLYLVDGLDEVRDAESRQRVSRAIEAAIDSPREPTFMVTCRYAGYTDDARLLARRFVELHLRPLNEDQVAEFVENWFDLVERTDPREPEEAERRAHTKARALVRALRQPRLRAKARVFGLTRNPLLLTAICLVHLERDEIPEKTTELYRECLAVMLDRWQIARKMKSRIEAGPAQQILQPVARWLHERRDKMATAEQLAPVLAPALAEAGVNADPGEFLRAIREESGLLTGWSGERYGLMHLGLQEYLTARQVAALAAAGDTAVLDQLASRFGDSWWQEVVLLLLGLHEREGTSWFTALMERVVEQPAFGEAEHAELVDQCLVDAAEVSAAPFIAVARRSPGRDEGLWARQRAALRVLDGLAPELVESRVLEQLAQGLRGHPSAEVKAWVDGRLRIGPDTSVAEPGGYVLVKIPGGTFMMGSPDGDEMASDSEKPQHEVTLSDFYLGQHPVTNEEYGRFLEANPRVKEPKLWGDRNYNQPRQPVVGVSWDEAMAYCEWAGLTLPTEAQWEYACRAGTTTRYWSGDTEEDLARVGWYVGNSGGTLHAVGEKPPNPFGLYDMHGNVDEWCRDAWTRDYADVEHQPGDGLHAQPVGDAERVVRGGIHWGFVDDARFARSACRSGVSPGVRSRILGLRPARVIPSSFTPSRPP
ncbi:MAG: SUMF1/EgtB/PvdO family nonheme iron enzyme [Nannocystaceae bacterium]